MRRDFVVSLLGHIALIALIIIVNPATTRLGAGPEIMTISLGGQDAPAAELKPAEKLPEQRISTPPESPAIAADQDIEESFSVRSPDTMMTVVKEKKPEAKPKPKSKPKQKQGKPTKQETKKEPELAQADTQSDHDTEGVKDDGKGGLDVSSAVSAGSGGGYGSGKGNYNLPYNLGLLERKVERLWRNPVSSPSGISCTVYFRVGRDGMLLSEPVVEKSSGIAAFDQEAIYAIKRVDRFPEFPTNFEYDYIGIHLDFAYAP